jgi:hypothetical protein
MLSQIILRRPQNELKLGEYAGAYLREFKLGEATTFIFIPHQSLMRIYFNELHTRKAI